MLREEFENRMGNTVTPEAFEEINNLYMTCYEMDKDAFCDDWKLHGSSKIIADLWKYYKINHDACKIYQEENKKAAELLIKLDWQYGVKEAGELAEAMLSKRGVIRYKLENGVALTTEEKEYIFDRL